MALTRGCGGHHLQDEGLAGSASKAFTVPGKGKDDDMPRAPRPWVKVSAEEHEGKEHASASACNE